MVYKLNFKKIKNKKYDGVLELNFAEVFLQSLTMAPCSHQCAPHITRDVSLAHTGDC